MDIKDKQITSLCEKPFGLNALCSRPDWLIWFGLVLTTAWMAMLEYKENPREGFTYGKYNFEPDSVD